MPLSESQVLKKPAWLKVRLPSHPNFYYLSSLLREKNLHTICQSAKCPNISECWSQRTATFLILGDRCTRSCTFCAVENGMPGPPSGDEPLRIVEAISALGLRYAVITSVTRDDLKDGGASAFTRTILAIRENLPGVKVEVLIPDFGGNDQALKTVIEARPDVLNHNLEVPEVVYPVVSRPRQNYSRSLEVLERAEKMGALTKSGLMVGLGEKEEDLLQTFSDLRRADCDLLTIGQYLQPSRLSAPVQKFYSPLEFEQLRKIALDFGFVEVEAGPLVRSSYLAHRMYASFQKKSAGSKDQ